MSRCLATAGLFDGTQLHGTPARRDIPRRPSNLTFVAVPKSKRNTSRRPPSALTIARTHGALFCSRTTFAQVLADSETLEQKRELNRERFDLVTANKYIVQKIQLRRGSSHGLTVPQEHHKARTSYRRALKKGVRFDPRQVHDRRKVPRVVAFGCCGQEVFCLQMDALAQEDHTNNATREERARYNRVICTRYLFTTLLTPPQQFALPLEAQPLPPQHQRTPDCDELSGRMCVCSPLACS